LAADGRAARRSRRWLLGAFTALLASQTVAVASAFQYIQPAETTPPQEAMETQQRPAVEMWYLVMNRNLPQGSLSVSIAGFDRSMVRLTCNLGDRQEIGTWRAPVAGADFNRLKELAKSSGYSGLAVNDPLPATMPTVSVGEGKLGDAPRLVAFAVNQVPPPVRLLLEAIETVVDQIREHPDQVLAGAVRPERERFATGKAVAFEITLRNPGSGAFRIRNPKLAPSARDTGLVLTLRQLGKAAPSGNDANEEREIEDTATVEIGPADIEFIREQPPNEDEDDPLAGSWLELLPEDEIRLRISRSAFLQPATYEAALVLSCRGSEKPEDRAIEGNLLMVAGQFEVVPADRR
jgi:hypothetical protein